MMWRPRRFFALVLGLALALALAERAAVALRARTSHAPPGASWIWADGVAQSHSPIAFYVVRDFHLEELPAEPARLEITADESYSVFLNGRRVATGAYRQGAALDVYDVGALLQPGANRMSVELASSRGAGGLLAGLRIGDETITTDGEWRVFRRFEPGLLRGWALDGGEVAKVWHRHPTGRWTLAPTPQEAVVPGTDPPDVWPALQARLHEEGDDWIDVTSLDAAELPNWGGGWTLFDWGEVITGYLVLDLEPGEGLPGILLAGTEIPDRVEPANTVIVPTPGMDTWIDPHPRRFRYAYIVGLDLRGTPVVRRSDPAIAAEAPEELGVLGLVPPRLDSAAEEQVRQRLGAKTSGGSS